MHDETYTEYHLTPNGWIIGTASYDKEKTERPSGSVQIWERHMFQSSPFSPEDISWKMLWADPNVPQEQHDALKAKFPLPPETGTVYKQYRKCRRKLADCY
jgi:hypothetical protein